MTVNQNDEIKSHRHATLCESKSLLFDNMLIKIIQQQYVF